MLEQHNVSMDHNGADIVHVDSPMPWSADCESYTPFPDEHVDAVLDAEGTIVKGKLGKTAPITRKPRRTKRQMLEAAKGAGP